MKLPNHIQFVKRECMDWVYKQWIYIYVCQRLRTYFWLIYDGKKGYYFVGYVYKVNVNSNREKVKATKTYFSTLLIGFIKDKLHEECHLGWAINPKISPMVRTLFTKFHFKTNDNNRMGYERSDNGSYTYWSIMGRKTLLQNFLVSISSSLISFCELICGILRIKWPSWAFDIYSKLRVWCSTILCQWTLREILQMERQIWVYSVNAWKFVLITLLSLLMWMWMKWEIVPMSLESCHWYRKCWACVCKIN